MAWVEQENKQEEENVPVSKLTRSGMTQEKPVFPNSFTSPCSCVALELNDVDGDRVPYTINRYLRDYQREGVRFIYNHYIRSSGCILGDDMGLGKTVQVKTTSGAKHFFSFISMIYFVFVSVAVVPHSLGHCFSCRRAAQNRHMGWCPQKQASVPAKSVTIWTR